MCGEKLLDWEVNLEPLGSPPRVRGKDDGPAENSDSKRITPACAGKRLISQPDTSHRQDHPRVCGEKSYSHRPIIPVLGITPACAGKSIFAFLHNFRTKDHPRVCGEKSFLMRLP